MDKGVSSELSDLPVDDLYCGLSGDVAPLIATMVILTNVPLVDCLWVQEVCRHVDHQHSFSGPASCSFVYSEHRVIIEYLIPCLYSVMKNDVGLQQKTKD